jgi:hypothetical protein
MAQAASQGSTAHCSCAAAVCAAGVLNVLVAIMLLPPFPDERGRHHS